MRAKDGPTPINCSLIHSSTVLRLMRITADLSAVCTINRHLLHGLPTSSGGDGQYIVCQTSGDYIVFLPLTCSTICWHIPTDDVGIPYTYGFPRNKRMHH